MSATSPKWSPSTPASSKAAPPGELLALSQLDPSELDSLSRLEAACREHDGGRLKLEWQALRSRPAGATSDFCWVLSGEIVGFVGLYQWRHVELELCGMVHPALRRLGIGHQLYGAAINEVGQRQVPRALLIVDRANAAGRLFALRRGGELEHSEHRMQQRREPEPDGTAPVIRLRRALVADAPAVAHCLAAAFEEEEPLLVPGDYEQKERIVQGTLVIEDPITPEMVGVMRVERDAATASIYAFCVLPERQGRGYGRAALARVTRDLRRSGVGAISLEVLSHNDRALRLYQACGFDAIGTEDYYSMPLSVRVPAGAGAFR